MSSSGRLAISMNSAAIFFLLFKNRDSFGLLACGILPLALAVLIPGGDPGFDRADVAIAAVAGAAHGADDDVIDDERESARNQNDLALHQAQCAMKSLGIGLQLIGGLGG